MERLKMSKVIAEYDTETKELKLMIDGKETSTVNYITFFSRTEMNYDGKMEKYGRFEAEFEKVEQDGVKYCMSAYGSKIENSNVIQEHISKSLLKK